MTRCMLRLTMNLPNRHLFLTLSSYTGLMRRNKMRLVSSLAVALVLTAQPMGLIWASGEGTTGADVLKIGVGARAIAMGEAYAAQADDLSALYWNPGGLALMQERQASFMYDQMYQGLNYSNAAIGIPLENGAVGGSVSYLGYGNI